MFEAILQVCSIQCWETVVGWSKTETLLLIQLTRCPAFVRTTWPSVFLTSMKFVTGARPVLAVILNPKNSESNSKVKNNVSYESTTNKSRTSVKSKKNSKNNACKRK